MNVQIYVRQRLKRNFSSYSSNFLFVPLFNMILDATISSCLILPEIQSLSSQFRGTTGLWFSLPCNGIWKLSLSRKLGWSQRLSHWYSFPEILVQHCMLIIWNSCFTYISSVLVFLWQEDKLEFCYLLRAGSKSPEVCSKSYCYITIQLFPKRSIQFILPFQWLLPSPNFHWKWKWKSSCSVVSDFLWPQRL